MRSFESFIVSYAFMLQKYTKFCIYPKKAVILQHKLKNVGKMSVHVQNSRMTTTRLRKMKQAGEKIAMLTSYDYTLTRLLDEAGI